MSTLATARGIFPRFCTIAAMIHNYPVHIWQHPTPLFQHHESDKNKSTTINEWISLTQIYEWILNTLFEELIATHELIMNTLVQECI